MTSHEVTLTPDDLHTLAESARSSRSDAPLEVASNVFIDPSDLGIFADHVSVNKPAGNITISVIDGEPEATWEMEQGGSAAVHRVIRISLQELTKRFGA